MRAQYTPSPSPWTRWLTPHVWKQAHGVHTPKKSSRWDLHPLLLVLLLMTWTAGDSEAERFVTARAYYVACHQHGKRPGRTLQGFQKALAKVPLPVLHAWFRAVRASLQQTFHRHWRTDGFVVLACDGTRLECPRSAELERRLPGAGKPGSAPTLYVTALVLLPAGLLWSWCVGPGTASEHDHLRSMLGRLPRRALLVADAFYQGYDLYTALRQAGASFLVRLSSRSELFTERRVPLDRFREGLVWYWPRQARERERPPLRLRLLRVGGHRGRRPPVWLLTDVLEAGRLSRQRAAELYRWRWHAEGVFRAYKRTLPKVRLWNRTEALVYREAEVALLGLQLVLAQAATKRRCDGRAVVVAGSARQQLLQIRGRVTTVVGAGLGPRQRRWYQSRLARVQPGGGGRKVRRRWPRRKDHAAPQPPKIRVIPKDLKAKFKQHLKAA